MNNRPFLSLFLQDWTVYSAILMLSMVVSRIVSFLKTRFKRPSKLLFIIDLDLSRSSEISLQVQPPFHSVKCKYINNFVCVAYVDL